MSKNSFKELEKLNIENRSGDQNKGKKSLNSNIRFFGFISNIIDLFIPKVGNVISSSLEDNDSKDRKPKKYPNK